MSWTRNEATNHFHDVTDMIQIESKVERPIDDAMQNDHDRNKEMDANHEKLLLKQSRISSIPNGWKLTRVGDDCSIRNDLRKPISVSERALMQGPYPYYGPTGILDYINEFLVEGEFALIGEDGDHFLKPNEKNQTIFASGQFNVNNHAHLIESTATCSSIWFATFFKHRDITNFLSRQGAKRYKLNKDTLEKLPILLPPLPEQKAIADLLSTWDEAIEKTERLIQAKERNLKSQIQKIMGRQAIETKGWSEVHLGELFTEVTHKVGEKELTPYSISAGIGFVSQREKWGKNISGSQHKNYTHLKTGEFSYNKGNSKRYQQGCIYLLKEGEICVPNVFISFKPKNKNVVPEFFEHYFIADYHARELKRYITSGARSDGLLNLNKKDFFKIKVPCPSPYEQKAIAEALTALQHEIDLLKQLAEKYKTQKRGLMQKMLTGEWRVKDEIISKYRET